MVDYAVAHLEEIEEIDDGRSPYRPVRHHLGITSFGATAWTGPRAGDRIINEHDEADDGHEELYLVTQGHAVFEVDGDRVDAPAGHLRRRPPGVKRTAVAEEAGTTVVASARPATSRTRPAAGRSGRRSMHATRQGSTPRSASACARSSPRIRITACCSTTSPAARASPARPTRRSTTCARRSSCPRSSARTRGTTRTSTRFAATPRSSSLVGDDEAGGLPRVNEARLEETGSGLAPVERRLVRRQRPGHAVDDVRDVRLRLRVREPGALVPGVRDQPGRPPARRAELPLPRRVAAGGVPRALRRMPSARQR